MARGSQFVVDLNVIETECENFKNCSGRYQNNTHSYFKNSYLTKCTDSQIRRAVNKISTYYENVKKDYEEIYKWWKSYIDNVNGLENYLSNQGITTLSEQSLINYLKCSLEELESYNFDIEIAYGSFNKQAENYNNSTNKINQLNNKNNYNYKNNFSGKANTQSLNKNKNTTNQSSNFNNTNFNFDGIDVNNGKGNSSLNTGEVTFNDVFGSGRQNNSSKNGSDNVAGFNIGSKIKSFFNSIEVLSDNTFNKGKKYSVQKSSVGFGTAAIAVGLGAFGSKSSKNKTNTETSRYGQGNYTSNATDTNSNSNNSNNRNNNFSNNNSSKNRDSYVNLMNTQNLEMGNNNFTLASISNISKKIIGLIKALSTNSMVICNTNGVNYKTPSSSIKTTGAKIGEVNNSNLLHRVELLKTNTPKLSAKANSKKVNDETTKKLLDNYTSIINSDPNDFFINDFISKGGYDYNNDGKIDLLDKELIEDKMKTESIFNAVDYINIKNSDGTISTIPASISTRKDIERLAQNTIDRVHEAGTTFFNNLNINLSRVTDEQYIKGNKHLTFEDNFEWLNASSTLNSEYSAELEEFNVFIDKQYHFYENLTKITRIINDFSSSDIPPQLRTELAYLLEDTIMCLDMAESETDNERILKANLNNLLLEMRSDSFSKIDDKNILLSSLLEEKSMTSQLIYQYEIARDQLKYNYIDKMEDYDELSDFSKLYDQCQFDENGNVIKKAKISYDYETKTIIINGVTYTDYIDYNDSNTIIDETGYVVKADHAYAMVDKLTLSYLVSKGYFEVSEGADIFLSQEYFSKIEFMNDNELKKYHYLYEKYGENYAVKYYATLEDTLNQREGFQAAIEYFNSLEGANYAEKLVSLHLTGIGDGVVNFVQGIQDIIYADGILSAEQYKQMWLLQILNGNVDLETFTDSDREIVEHLLEEYEKTGKSLGYSNQIGNTIGNMLPSMVLSYFITPLAGSTAASAISSTLIGASTFGNTKNQALHDGYSVGNANTQALLSAIAEGGLEFALGNIPGISKESTNTIVGFIKEGGEECLQEFVGMCISMANGEYINFDQFTETEIQTFIMSVIVSAEMNGANTAISVAGNTIVLSADKINQICNEKGVAGVEAYIKGQLTNNGVTDVENTTITQNDAKVDVLEDIDINDVIIEEINENNSNVNSEQTNINSNDIKLEEINEHNNSINNGEIDIDINDISLSKLDQIINRDIGTINPKNSKVIDGIKKVGNNVLAYSELVSSIGILFGGIFVNPLILPSGIVLCFDGAFRLNQILNNMTGTSHSLFKSSKNGWIGMFPTLKQINDSIKLTKKHGANQTFLLQLSNCFMELNRYDANGDIRTYHGSSHIGTMKQLKKLAKAGFITNLQINERQGRSLGYEKLILGNSGSLSNNKAVKMYEFGFELTEKKFTVEDAYNLYNSNYNGIAEIKTDKKGNQYLGFKENNQLNNNQTIEITEINGNFNNQKSIKDINLNDFKIENINQQNNPNGIETSVEFSINTSNNNLDNVINNKVDDITKKIVYNNMTIEEINSKLKKISSNFEHNSDAKSFIDDRYLNLQSLSGDYGTNQGIVNWMFQKHSTDFQERLDILIDYLKKQLPDMNSKNFIKYISTLDSAQGGICSYAPQVNAIINFFMDKQTLFKEKFGLDLFYTRKGTDGRNIDFDVAQDILLADFFTFINKYNYLNNNDIDFKLENGELVYKYKSGINDCSIENSLLGIDQTLTQYSMSIKMGMSKYIIPIMDYFKSKGLDLSVKYNSLYNDKGLNPDFVSLDFQKKSTYLLENIKEALNKNETIMIVVSKGKTDGIYVYNTPETSISNDNVFAWTGKQEFNNNKLSKHAMTITGVTENGMLIVDTWGYRKYISIEEFIKNGAGHISSITIEQQQLDVITQYYLDNKVTLKYITKAENLFVNDNYNISNISQYIDICKKTQNESELDFIDDFYKKHNRILNENELKIVNFIKSKNDYQFKSILNYFMDKGQFVEVEQYYSFYEKMGFLEQQEFLNFMLKDDKIFNNPNEIISAVSHHFAIKNYIEKNLSSKFSDNVSNKFNSLEFSSKFSNEQIENFCESINFKNNENPLNEAFIDIILNSNTLSSDNIELITEYINAFTLPKFINTENIADFVEFVYEIPYSERNYKNIDNIINFYGKLNEFNLEKDSYSKIFMEHYGMAKRINFDINIISIDKMKQLCSALDSKVSENKLYTKIYEYVFNYTLTDINNQNINNVINTISNDLVLPTNCDESMLTSIIHFIDNVAKKQNSYNINNYKVLIEKVEAFYNVDIGYGNGAKALVFEKFLGSNQDGYNVNPDLLLKWTKEIFDICNNKLGQYNINNSQENTLLSRYYQTQDYTPNMFDKWCEELGITKKDQTISSSLDSNADNNFTLIQQQNRLNELERIKQSDNYKNDSLYKNNIEKEYFKLKNINDIKNDTKIENPSANENSFNALDNSPIDLDLDATMDMIIISKLENIISNPQIVDKFLDFENNLDYFGSTFNKEKYFKSFDNFKNEIDKGDYSVSDEAYKNLTQLLAINLEKQIIDNNVEIDNLIPYKMLENIVENEDVRKRYFDFDNNIEYFGNFSKKQYLEKLKAIELAIIDDKLIVTNSFKHNLNLILSKELKSIDASFYHTFYALSKLDDIFLNLNEYGPNQRIIQKMLKNPQNYVDRFLLIEDCIRKQLPGISDKQIYKFLSSLNAPIEDGGNGGICSYAATVGSILNYFFYHQQDFKNTFGTNLLYDSIDGHGKELAQDLIIAELYAYINKGNWITFDLHPNKKVGPDFKRKINGDWKYKYNLGVYNKEYSGVDQSIVRYYKNVEMSKSLECIPVTSYLKSKNLNLGLEFRSIYNSYKMSTEYQKMSTQEKISFLVNEIQKSLDNEKYLTIDFFPKQDNSLELYSNKYCNTCVNQLDNGGHIMTVTGLTYSEVDKSPIVKVSTWAGIKYFKLSDYINNGRGTITELNIHNIENNWLVNFYVENNVKLDELNEIQLYLNNNPSANMTDVKKILNNYRMKNYPFRTLMNKVKLEAILNNMTLIKQKFESKIETIKLKKQQKRLNELEQIRNSVYNTNEMPLSNKPDLRVAQEKVINGVELSFKDKLILGRDHPIKNIDGYELKPNCVYRAISEELYNEYLKKGYIYGYDINDEYQEYTENGKLYNNNKGVDWYLGGVDLKYGTVIIECPASKEYFTPAFDNGSGMSFDPTVRHMKSSGYKKPVPMSMVRVIKHPNIDIDINKLNNENIVYNSLEIEKEYFKLKNIVDIKTLDETVFLKNELNRLLELQQLNPNDVKLNKKIGKIIEVSNIIEQKKKKITNITGEDIHTLAKQKVKETDVPANILKPAENYATEILKEVEKFEKQITNDMKALESSNSSLIGEEYKIKGHDSLTRKIISDALTNINKNTNEKTKKTINDLSQDDISLAASEIGDGLRYTLLIDDAFYKDNVKSSLDELTSKGYKIVKFKNRWDKPHYKGINVSIESPTGLLFELQFHTPSSFKTKETLTHEFYQINRNISLTKDVRDTANDIQIAYQSLVDIPEDIMTYNWLDEYNAKYGNIEILEIID